ncbi:MAG: hypothetical protein MK486_02255 [Gemmatimonadetes bacterium]|nr:hypothetical protein [Gemmatimonadota bacterium]
MRPDVAPRVVLAAGLRCSVGRDGVANRGLAERLVPGRAFAGCSARRLEVPGLEVAARGVDPDEFVCRGDAADGVAASAVRRVALGFAAALLGAEAGRRGAALRIPALGTRFCGRLVGAAELGVVATPNSLYCVARRGSGGAWRYRTSGDQPSPVAPTTTVYRGRFRRGLGKTTRVPA